jgi:hypothetical protein
MSAMDMLSIVDWFRMISRQCVMVIDPVKKERMNARTQITMI